jgi:hypothetical protein
MKDVYILSQLTHSRAVGHPLFVGFLAALGTQPTTQWFLAMTSFHLGSNDYLQGSEYNYIPGNERYARLSNIQVRII